MPLPGYIILPEAPPAAALIVVLLGRRFPLIGAHSACCVCAWCRGCTGRFEPAHDRPCGHPLKLLPRRHCHFAYPQLSRRRGVARRHEPRALRLAAGLRHIPATPSARREPKATSGKSLQVRRLAPTIATSSSISFPNSPTTYPLSPHRSRIRLCVLASQERQR